MKAFKYYFIPWRENGLAGIVVQPTPDLHTLQEKLIRAVAPFSIKSGTAAAFVTEEEGRDIQPSLIEYVANFVKIAAKAIKTRTRLPFIFSFVGERGG